MYTLYFVSFENYPTLVKIGITKNLNNRMNQLSRVHGRIISGRWHSYARRKEVSIIEKRLHSLFSKFRINVEGNGGTEFFDSYKSFRTGFNLDMYLNFYTIKESGTLHDFTT